MSFRWGEINMKDRVIGAVFVVLLTLVMLLPGGVVSAIVLNII